MIDAGMTEEEKETKRLVEHRCLICGKGLPKSFKRPIHTSCIMHALGDD